MDFVIIPNLITYEEGISLMSQYVQSLLLKKSRSSILLMENYDVYTAGSSVGNISNLDSNLNILKTDRGGKITYHGPGQRIIYPILDLSIAPLKKDIRHLIRFLLNWIHNTIKRLGIESCFDEENIGLWVQDGVIKKKLVSIGIKVKRWVSFHGIAVNISTDISRFEKIVPCGILNCRMTSLEELGIKISMEEFDIILKKEFDKLFYSF